MSLNIGYTTMTGDLLHEGHIKFLQTSKSLCDTLIVGLTTDCLAAKQKRKTWSPFSQRYAVISALRCVDIVVEHNGQSKSSAHSSLNFTSLFIGDDYVGSDEYMEFKEKHPEVKIYFIPRTSGVSSSDIISGFEDRMIEKMSVKNKSIGGSVIEVELDRGYSIIIKQVCIGNKEGTSTVGADSYGIAIPPPRNWKVGKNGKNKYPMISGVNGYREINIHEKTKRYEWDPFIKSKRVYMATDSTIAHDRMGKIASAQYERQHPSEIYWLYQRNAGPTLAHFMKNLSNDEKNNNIEQCKVVFAEICKTIRTQITQLNNLGIVHGDLHPGNICIDENKVVSFIDFGWCLCASFDLEPDELSYLESCLLSDFDWNHFINSLCSFELNIYV